MISSTAEHLSVIRSFLAEFEHYHSTNPTLEESRPGEDETDNVWLVDVVDQKLVNKSTGVRYLALSYAWGQSTTISSNDCEPRSVDGGRGFGSA